MTEVKYVNGNELFKLQNLNIDNAGNIGQQKVYRYMETMKTYDYFYDDLYCRITFKQNSSTLQAFTYDANDNFSVQPRRFYRFHSIGQI